LTDERALSAARRLERLAYKLPVARARAKARADAVDGWPERGESLGIRGTTDPDALTPTEAAASARLKQDQAMEDVESRVRAIVSAAEVAERECDKITGGYVALPECTGGAGQDGAAEWGYTECRARPEPGRPLCARCRKAKNRWANRS
jgi:hypothetical protein